MANNELTAVTVEIEKLKVYVTEHEKADLMRHAEIDRRMHEANRFRNQIASERLGYLTRDLYDREHEGLAKRVSLLELTSTKIGASFWMLGAGMSLAVGLATFIAQVWFR